MHFLDIFLLMVQLYTCDVTFYVLSDEPHVHQMVVVKSPVSFFSIIIGVVETGLFVNMAECAIFGQMDGTVSTR